MRRIGTQDNWHGVRVPPQLPTEIKCHFELKFHWKLGVMSVRVNRKFARKGEVELH